MVIPHSMVLVGFFFMLVAVVVRFRANVTGELGGERDDVERADDDRRLGDGGV